MRGQIEAPRDCAPGHETQQECVMSTSNDTTNTPTKKCSGKCGLFKPYSEFYTRANGTPNSECKECMKARPRNQTSLERTVPRVVSERIAIAELKTHGIHALPGKAISAKWVDVVAWGCVEIEVKYSRLRGNNSHEFVFSLTTKQQTDGLRAHIIMLICDYGDQMTFHLFPINHPVFRNKQGGKSALTYVPDKYRITARHNKNQPSLDDKTMETYQDQWDVIEGVRLRISAELMNLAR